MFKKIIKTFSHINNINNYIDIMIRYSDVRKTLINQKKISYKRKRLLAIYDFIDMPYSSDISIFILNAEIERRKKNLEWIDIIFIADDTYPATKSYQASINTNNYKQLLHNFALEYSKLFNTIGSIHILNNRNQAIDYFKTMKKNHFIFPYDYNPEKPYERILGQERALSFYITNYTEFANKENSINFLKPTSHQIKLVQRWIKYHIYPQIPITITLRETDYTPKRNNNIKEWQKLIDYFSNNKKFKFIIMRDYYNLYTNPNLIGSNVIYCNEAVISNSFRAALHQESSLNLFIPNGPNIVSLFSNKTKYIQFKIITEGVHATTKEFLERTNNLYFNNNWHGATKYQKLVWEDDNFETLKYETSKMLDLLEEENELIPKFYLKDTDKNIEKEEKVTYNKEIFKKESLISSRISTQLCVLIFQLTKSYKKIFNKTIYKSIFDIKLKKDTKIIFYGAGTITINLIPKYKKNISCLIDINYDKLHSKKIEGIDIFPLESIETIDFDFIFISPQNREISIINYLVYNFNIPHEKFLVLDKQKIQKEFEENLK